MKKSFFTTITPFSKFLALAILVAGPFAGFYLGIKYQKSLALSQESQKAETALREPEKTEVDRNSSQTKDTYNDNIGQQFINSEYRVLKVLKNPHHPSYLIIATERSEATCGDEEYPAKCENDTGCGGAYYSPVCYFFEEPDFVYGADPLTRFIGTYEGYSIDLDSFNFEESRKVSFVSGFGDAGYSIITKNTLDLTTGETTLVSTEESNIEL